MAGSSMLRMEVSLITHTSARSSSRCSSMKGVRLGDETSSSPSIRNLTLTGAAPPVWRYDSSALTWTNNCPLSSVAPRAKILPSRTTGSKGSLSQPSSMAAGTTS